MIYNLPDLATAARLLGGELRGREILAPGPGHSAHDRSLSVQFSSDAPDGFLVYSFAGDDNIVCKDYVRQRWGLDPFKPISGNGRAQHRRTNGAKASAPKSDDTKRRVVATYPYTDADGTLLYQVLRYKPKGFNQRRPDGKGGWIWKLGDVRRVLYRLPELLKYPDATIVVTEGEEDADRVASLNHCATTVACGDWKGIDISAGIPRMTPELA